MEGKKRKPFSLTLVGKSSPFGGKITYPESVAKVHPDAGLRMGCAFNTLGEILDILEQMKPSPEMDEEYLDFMKALFNRIMLAAAFLIAPTKEKVDDMIKDILSGVTFNNFMQRA